MSEVLETRFSPESPQAHQPRISYLLREGRMMVGPSFAMRILEEAQYDKQRRLSANYELITIDENLLRENLTPTQEAAQIVRRKQIYERLHPGTAHGGDRKSSRQNDDLKKTNEIKRFTAATAKAVGKSEASIQRAARRGEALGAETLKRIAGTSLDKGIELDGLIKMKPEEREELIRRAENGEQVSIANKKEGGRGRPPLAIDKRADFKRLMDAWKQAAQQTREEFLKRVTATTATRP